jgi:hypothetical protein
MMMTRSGASLLVLVVVCSALSTAAANGIAFRSPTKIEFIDVDDDCEDTAKWLAEERLHEPHITLLNSPRINTTFLIDRKQHIAPAFSNTNDYTLLCLTYTYVKALPKAALIHNTWGKNCTRHVIVTNEGDPENVDPTDVIRFVPDGIGETYRNLWMKTRGFLKRLAYQVPGLGDYDFYFFGGDDVFMIPPNAQALFNEPSVRTANENGAPLLFGHRMVSPIGDRITLPDTNESVLTTSGHELQKAFVLGARGCSHGTTSPRTNYAPV